jgi:hypothetical protein
MCAAQFTPIPSPVPCFLGRWPARRIHGICGLARNISAPLVWATRRIAMDELSYRCGTRRAGSIRVHSISKLIPCNEVESSSARLGSFCCAEGGLMAELLGMVDEMTDSCVHACLCPDAKPRLKLTLKHFNNNLEPHNINSHLQARSTMPTARHASRGGRFSSTP